MSYTHALTVRLNVFSLVVFVMLIRYSHTKETVDYRIPAPLNVCSCVFVCVYVFCIPGIDPVCVYDTLSDQFDRWYRAAYQSLTQKEVNRMHVYDSPPTSKTCCCRKTFNLLEI